MFSPQLFCGWWAFFYALHFGGSKSGLHACLLACTRNLLAGVPECLPCVADFGEAGSLSGFHFPINQSFDFTQACSELVESDGERTCLEHSRKSRTINYLTNDY